MYYHRAWADIDVDALTRNLTSIRSALCPGTEVMAVVKADAYGHGASTIARTLQDREGVWGFGVGDSREALELRDAGVSSPIVILGAIIEDEIGRVLENGISVCVHSTRRIERLNREAQRQGKRLEVHLMVDTGMGRLGVTPEKAIDVAAGIVAAPGLDFAGVATHYACTSEPDDPFTAVQLRRFVTLKESLVEAGIAPAIFHASNSSSIFSSLSRHFDVVRPGISLLGIAPDGNSPAGIDLEPVLSLRTQVVFMKDIPAGTPVGYNRTYTTPRATRIATIPIGYNDGYPFRLSNRGRVLIRGRRAPVVGGVTMDYTMVDIGHIPGVEVGDMVTLIGRDGDESISVDEIARMVGSIYYEVTCLIGKRVQRIARKTKSEKPQAEMEAKSDEVGAPIGQATLR